MFAGDKRLDMMGRMVDYNSRDSPYILVGQQGDGYSPNIADALRILREDNRSHEAKNDKLIEAQKILARAQEKQAEVNVVILHSLSDLQRQG